MTRQDPLDRALALLDRLGIARSLDLERTGVSRGQILRIVERGQIERIVERGQIERVGRSLYRRPGAPRSERKDLAEVARRVPGGVGWPEAARRALEEALAIRREVLTEGHPLTLQAVSNLALPTWYAGEREAAVALLEDAASGLRRLGVDGEEGLAAVLSSLAGMSVQLGDLERAQEALDESLRIRASRLGPEHPSLATPLAHRASLLQRFGRVDEARATWRRSVELRRAAGTALETAEGLVGYGRFLVAIEDLDAAAAAFTEAHDALASDPAIENVARARVLTELGGCEAQAGRIEAALRSLRMAKELLAGRAERGEEVAELEKRIEELGREE